MVEAVVVVFVECFEKTSSFVELLGDKAQIDWTFDSNCELVALKLAQLVELAEVGAVGQVEEMVAYNP